MYIHIYNFIIVSQHVHEQYTHSEWIKNTGTHCKVKRRLHSCIRELKKQQRRH